MGDIWSIKEQYKRSMGALWSVGNRGIAQAGGQTPSIVNTVGYINIAATGNATDFGDLSVAREHVAGTSNETRGVFLGGLNPSAVDTIDYIILASTGNAADFGNLTATRRASSAAGNAVRGIIGAGNAPAVLNILEHISYVNVGNSIDFGDLTVSNTYRAATSSSTRGIWWGGGSSPFINVIDYITIASVGNAIDFGDLTTATGGGMSTSNSTRGLFGGGYTPTFQVTTEYITIASTGDAKDFGDLTDARNYGSQGNISNKTRGVISGGADPSAIVDVIDYVTIASAGDATDFGNLTTATKTTGGCSQGHGGIEEGEPRGSAFNIHELQAHTGQRGFATGGNTPTKINTIQYATLSTLGNMVDFGDRSSTASGGHAALGSATRACMAGSWGGPSPSYMDNIDVIEMAHRGNTSDFGNLSQKRGDLGGGGNATRGVFFGGYSTTPSAAKLNIMEYITISTVGDVTDFGDLSSTRGGTPCGTSSPTRLVIEGGSE